MSVMVRADVPALILAPMEGVTDAPMRAVQGETGAFTFAVSEFFRINYMVPYQQHFHRHVPELRTNSKTPTGLPVQIQLLGGNAALMAESAAAAVEAGADAIDLNFGCPAKTVNRHDGGATLLKYPARIREIVSAVRRAVPAKVPVSAKLRLGWDNIDAIFENAEMAAEGGANWLTIHARTRIAGYAPPVFWPHIGRVRDQLKIPIVANGDIWTIDDFRRCREETGCIHYMLGRGALANPTLPRQAAEELGLLAGSQEGHHAALNWSGLLRRLVERSGQDGVNRPDRILCRLKQWLFLAAKFGTFRDFDAVKRTVSIDDLFATLQASLI